MRIDFWHWRRNGTLEDKLIRHGTFTAKSLATAKRKARRMMPTSLHKENWRHTHHSFHEKTDRHDRFVIQQWNN